MLNKTNEKKLLFAVEDQEKVSIVYVPIKNISLHSAIRLFANDLFVNEKANSTIEAYQRDLNNFSNYIKENFSSIRNVKQITLSHLTQYKLDLMALSEKGELSKNTINRRVDCLKSFFNFLYRNGYVEKNIMVYISYKSDKMSLPNFLEQYEINSIIDAVEAYPDVNRLRNIAILKCLKFLGCRRGELLKLKWSDIEFYKNQICITREKTNNVDCVQVPTELIKSLINYYQSVKDKKHEYVFISNKNTPLSKSALNDAFKKCIEISGIKKDFAITPHTFRHSFITYLKGKNMADDKIRKFTGHSNNSSLQVYTHMTTNDTIDVANAFV